MSLGPKNLNGLSDHRLLSSSTFTREQPSLNPAWQRTPHPVFSPIPHSEAKINLIRSALALSDPSHSHPSSTPSELSPPRTSSFGQVLPPSQPQKGRLSASFLNPVTIILLPLDSWTHHFLPQLNCILSYSHGGRRIRSTRLLHHLSRDIGDLHHCLRTPRFLKTDIRRPTSRCCRI